MFLQRRRKLREGPQHSGFGLFGVVGANGSDRSLVTLRHVGIRVPLPLDCTRALNERSGDFAFKERSFALRRAAGDFVDIQLALQSSLLNQHGLAWLLGRERIPQDRIVLPPGMIGSEIDRGSPECRGRAVDDTAFVLSDGNELLRAGRANRIAHRSRPLRKEFLGKKKIVVNSQRVVAGVFASRRKLFRTRQRNHAGDGGSGNIPLCGELCAVGITFAQPAIPTSEFDRISIRTHRPEMLRNAGLVDEIPGEKRHVVKARDDRRN